MFGFGVKLIFITKTLINSLRTATRTVKDCALAICVGQKICEIKFPRILKACTQMQYSKRIFIFPYILIISTQPEARARCTLPAINSNRRL